MRNPRMVIEILIYKQLADRDFNNGDYEEAKKNYTEAKTHEKFKDESKQERAKVLLGYAKSCIACSKKAKEKMVDLNSAQQALENARHLCKGEPDSEIIKGIDTVLFDVYINQGWIHFTDFDTLEHALSVYAEADSICSKYRMPEEDTLVVELRDLYRCILCKKADKEKDYESKIYFYDEARKVLEKQISLGTKETASLMILADIHLNMADAHHDKKNRADAITHYLIARSIYRALKVKDSDPKNQAECDKGIKHIDRILQKPEYSRCPTNSSLKNESVSTSIEEDEDDKQNNNNNSGSSQFPFFKEKKKHTKSQHHSHSKKHKKDIQSSKNANDVQSDEEQPLKRQKESQLNSPAKSLVKKNSDFKCKDDNELELMDENELQSYHDKLVDIEKEKTYQLNL